MPGMPAIVLSDSELPLAFQGAMDFFLSRPWSLEIFGPPLPQTKRRRFGVPPAGVSFSMSRAAELFDTREEIEASVKGEDAHNHLLARSLSLSLSLSQTHTHTHLPVAAYLALHSCGQGTEDSSCPSTSQEGSPAEAAECASEECQGAIDFLRGLFDALHRRQRPKALSTGAISFPSS